MRGFRVDRSRAIRGRIAPIFPVVLMAVLVLGGPGALRRS